MQDENNPQKEVREENYEEEEEVRTLIKDAFHSLAED